MTLHVVRAGSGEPTLLIHSGGMSGRQFRKLAEILATTHEVIVPDLIGSGENAPWTETRPFHFSEDVAELAAIVDAVGGSAHLVGHSYGGLLALMLAKEEPRRARSIAVYDPVAFGTVHAAQDPEGMVDAVAVEKNPVFLDDAVGGTDAWYEVFVDYWNGPGAWRALPPPSREAFLRVGKKVYAEVRSLMADRTPASDYARIDAPTLLLHGEKSPPAARRVVALLGAAMPRATVHAITGAGHMGPLTRADEVNAAITAHVREASGDPA